MNVDCRSVLIYLISFGFALFFFVLAERRHERADEFYRLKGTRESVGRKLNLHVDGHLWAIIGMLILSSLAGFRASTVGVDTKFYPVYFMSTAAGYDNYISMLGDPNIDFMTEPLNAALVYVCSRFTAETTPLLFFYQLFTVLPVYFAAYQLRERAPLAIAMVVYVFFFFNNSLNMMRQSVTCALCLLAFVGMAVRKHCSLQDIALVFVALAFHKSGVYGLLLVIAASLAFASRQLWLKFLLLALVAVIPAYLSQIGEFLIASNLVDYHMKVYFDVFVTGSLEKDWFVNPLGGYSVSYLLMYGALVFLPSALGGSLFSPDYSSRDAQSVELSKYVGFLTKIGFVIYAVLLFSLNTMYGGRFSLFFDYFLIASIPLSCTGEARLSKSILALLLLIAVWFCWIMVLGWSGSQVYAFAFE